MNNRKYKILVIAVLALFFAVSCDTSTKKEKQQEKPKQTEVEIQKPKIVNIINFIRLLEPRYKEVTEDVLYQTVVKQIEIMKKHNLRGSFLLQYDALMDSRYQKLLKELPKGFFEIGAWWEIPQPMAEKAGLKWRGRFPWDWHADVGFATGYTPAEREKLADVYMNDFKAIFGYYPTSVASWFIDAHTLNYLYEKYNITTSANCKDQYGTDGYTLWGGYWNQAYYPSKVNSYMPAQNKENQIPVPIFRLLGSDPVRQYDLAIGSSKQGVVSLEPVYPESGGDEKWIHWYFKQFIEGESIEYAYTQAGQENSFTWNAMSKGYEIQMPLIAKLRDENKIKVETLSESGKWFRDNYEVTPATSVTINEDIEGSNLKTVWFNSRFYRVNLLWEDDGLRFRDIHLFDENITSNYLNKKATSNKCTFFTLPLVDGFLWSKSGEELAGLRFKKVVEGKETLLQGEDPTITSPEKGTLHILWPLKNEEGTIVLDLDERKMSIKYDGKAKLNWFLDLTTSSDAKLPFEQIKSNTISSKFKNTDYSVEAKKGTFSVPNDRTVFRISPSENKILLDLELDKSN